MLNMNRRQTLARPASRVPRYLVLGLALSIPVALPAQKPAGAGTGTTSLPDSPQPKQDNTSNVAVETTSKFIGYVSNRSIAFPDIANTPGPLSTGGKFRLFVNQSISPPFLLAAGISAAYGQARDVPEAYEEGWGGYGRRYGAAMARASSNSFFSTFVLASAFHQDPRFFPQYRPTFWGSVKYSAHRIIFTRTDSGESTVNTSGLLGPLAAEGLANAYLPVSEQTVGKNFERYGTDMAWKFAGNMFKNYWPTLFHDMGLNRLKVIPDPGSPDAPKQPN
jgi:hypothetical protein